MKILHIENSPLDALGLNTFVQAQFENVSVIHISTACDDNQTTEKHEAVDLIIIEPDGNIESIKCILKQYPLTNVLVLTGYLDTRFGLNCMLVGAKGYILKTNPVEVIKLAIETLISGNLFLSSTLTHSLRALLSGPVKLELSSREREIIKHLLDGKTSGEISQMLRLKQSTVATQKARALSKLGVRNVVELSKLTMKHR